MVAKVVLRSVSSSRTPVPASRAQCGKRIFQQRARQCVCVCVHDTRHGTGAHWH